MLIAACITGALIMWLLWPSDDPRSPPDCYGDYPFKEPQTSAERDCRHCPYAYACFEDSIL